MNPSTQKQLVQKLDPKGALIVCVIAIIAATLAAILINGRAQDDDEPPPTVESQTDLRVGDFGVAANSNVSGVVGSHNSNIKVSNGSNFNNGANSNNIVNSNVNNSTKVDKSVRRIENKTYNHQVNQYNQYPHQPGRVSALINSTPRPAVTPPPAAAVTADRGISRRRDDPELQRLYEKLDRWGLRGEQIIGSLSVTQCGAAYAEWERGCPAILREINDHVRLEYGLVKFFDREFGIIPSMDSLYLPADELFGHCKDIFHRRAETLRKFSALVEHELSMLKE
jgi:hypothetical protein